MIHGEILNIDYEQCIMEDNDETTDWYKNWMKELNEESD